MAAPLIRSVPCCTAHQGLNQNLSPIHELPASRPPALLQLAAALVYTIAGGAALMGLVHGCYGAKGKPRGDGAAVRSSLHSCPATAATQLLPLQPLPRAAAPHSCLAACPPCHVGRKCSCTLAPLPAGAECASYSYDTWPWAVTFGSAMIVLAQASARKR